MKPSALWASLAEMLTPRVALQLPNFPFEAQDMLWAMGSFCALNVNHIYLRSGSVWEGRFKASLIQAEEYLLTCYRYIELNPVRADMVNDPGDYR